MPNRVGVYLEHILAQIITLLLHNPSFDYTDQMFTVSTSTRTTYGMLRSRQMQIAYISHFTLAICVKTSRKKQYWIVN